MRLIVVVGSSGVWWRARGATVVVGMVVGVVLDVGRLTVSVFTHSDCLVFGKSTITSWPSSVTLTSLCMLKDR